MIKTICILISLFSLVPQPRLTQMSPEPPAVPIPPIEIVEVIPEPPAVPIPPAEIIEIIPEPPVSPIPTAVHKWYTEDDVIAIAKTLYGECRGTAEKTRQSGVVWCILNRYDMGKYGSTITAVVSAKDQFMGYNKNNPIRDDLEWLARDVLDRWSREKDGETNVGRTLPKEYRYFRDAMYNGEKCSNVFYDHWEPNLTTVEKIASCANIWKWSLGNPYGEVVKLPY